MTAPDFTTVRSQDRHTLQQLYRQLRERERRGQPADRMRARFAADYAASQDAVAARRAALPAPKLSANLPVLAVADKIRRLIADNQVVIISGETGSGKTTQLPQLCLALGLGRSGDVTRGGHLFARPRGDLVGGAAGGNHEADDHPDDHGDRQCNDDRPGRLKERNESVHGYIIPHGRPDKEA